ncbi:MAG TPA: VOC family protein [Dinghuibacter sp.]|uniref:VOC family protein n=1 Tax=Dinghuibacter sp. TaxID=2024697 RepID=UPI002BAE840F|nr:VOC family protein [Dinghuibacter sp.]HTJ11400.1 VOC family protein [Dinghuibacter sp.]
MIKRLSHVCIYVLDQDCAEDFYVNKLGLEVHTNAPLAPGIRWLTVRSPQQPDLELTLLPVVEGMMFDKGAAEKMRDLIKRGTFGYGVFETEDVFATYEELKAKGVEFKKAPKEEFYGIECIFKDDSGNWYSLSQPKKE